MSMPTFTVGGVAVGRLGYGLMNFTWKPTQTPDKQAFEAMKIAIDSGSTFFNSGEFYGQPDPESGMHLLARFFAAEPEYASRVFLSVKGGVNLVKRAPDGNIDVMRASVVNINKLLTSEGGTKKMDLFEPARLDKEVGIEQVMKNMLTLRDEGHFTHIGLSEVSAATLRKASSIGKVDAVEFEYSPWAMEPEKNGMLAACKELGVAGIAYSPLARGFLTGTLKSRADIPEGDHRLHFDKFSEENFHHNLKLADELQAFAEKKGVTPVQLCLAFEIAQWEGIIPIPGSTRPEGVKEAVEATKVELSQVELAAVRAIIDSHTILGGRYNAQMEGGLEA